MATQHRLRITAMMVLETRQFGYVIERCEVCVKKWTYLIQRKEEDEKTRGRMERETGG